MFNKNKITLETRENKLDKIKKKGFKKAFFTTVMSMGVLLGCAGMLVGCGEAGPKGDTGAQGPQGEQGIQGIQGVPGVAGSMWFTGTAIAGTGTEIEAAVENTKVGDIYFNTTTCDLYQCVDENTWNWLANLKGDEGRPGEPGQPGQPGSTGATGAAWLTGVAVTGIGSEINATVTNARVGDLYFNTDTCDIYQCTAENTWNWISNIKGDKGKDGTSVYVGYDGYIWNGAERTEFQATNVTLGENVVENTIGIEGIMSKYFAGSYIDLSENTVALMANYMPYSQVTQYSGTKIVQIKVVAEKAGNLYIGTAKVADIVNARTNGSTYTSSTTAYEVQAGLNTITFATPITVAEDETIILGGQGSVGLYNVQGISFNDEDGNFTVLDKTSHINILSKTNEILDTLAVQVKISNSSGYVYNSVIADMPTSITNDNISGAIDVNLSQDYNPYIFGDTSIFTNKSIARIGFAVKKVKAIDDNQTITVYLIDNSDIKTTNVRKNPYTLTIPQSEISNATYNSATQDYDVNKWIYIDVSHLNIVVGEGQTIGFSSDDDKVVFGYTQTNETSDPVHSFYINSSKSTASISKGYLLHVDVQTLEEVPFEFEKHLTKLKENESILQKKTEIKNALNNLNFSILGDSISSFENYSNSIEVNSTLANNENYYGGTSNMGSSILSSVEETWWKKVSNYTGMNVLVNNSWSGSKVLDSTAEGGYGTRSQNLHDNTITNNPGNDVINPDIIAVYLGTNDIHTSGITLGTFDKDTMDNYLKNQTVPQNFVEAYAVMINNIIKNYGKDGVFCFTLLPFTRVADTKTEQYNNVIKQIANYFDVKVVDLYTNCNVELNSKYFGEGTYTHPNSEGMIAIANCFIDVLYNTYVTNAA